MLGIVILDNYSTVLFCPLPISVVRCSLCIKEIRSWRTNDRIRRDTILEFERNTRKERDSYLLDVSLENWTWRCLHDSLESGGVNKLSVVVAVDENHHKFTAEQTVSDIKCCLNSSDNDVFWNVYLTIGSRLERVSGCPHNWSFPSVRTGERTEDHVFTCTSHSVVKKVHDWAVEQITGQPVSKNPQSKDTTGGG